MGPWVGWAITFGTLIVIALLVLWWVMSVGLKPVPDPSGSVSPSGTASGGPAPTMADADGHWCPTDPEDDRGCVTITLPTATFDNIPDEVQYVFPPGSTAEDDPDAFDYGVDPNMGGCWNGAMDTLDGESGVPFTYCPTGSVPGEESIDDGDSSQDRLYIGDQTEYPYLRAN